MDSQRTYSLTRPLIMCVSPPGSLPPLPKVPKVSGGNGAKGPGSRAATAAQNAGMIDFAGDEHATRHALVLRPLSREAAMPTDDGLQNSVPVLVTEDRAWGADSAFDPTQTGSFPMKAPELFPLSDYVDTDGPDLPPMVHPFGWVPDRQSTAQQRCGGRRRVPWALLLAILVPFGASSLSDSQGHERGQDEGDGCGCGCLRLHLCF